MSGGGGTTYLNRILQQCTRRYKEDWLSFTKFTLELLAMLRKEQPSHHQILHKNFLQFYRENGQILHGHCL